MKRVVVHPVVIALGSNLGDREGTIDRAVSELDATPGVRVTAVSPVLETIALTLHGLDEAEPRYLNAVALIDTVLGPEEVLRVCHQIEQNHGRVRTQRWGSRTLDLDVIDYDHMSIRTPDLELPHPRAAGRDFVLAPWLSVDPEAWLPGQGRVADLLATLREQQ
ncbi:MAG TPA: 2-amino-4-hydroxy-6-hydroxymethyldihydropteridine diphosphokinase [Pseudoclavibacter sp.]|nr:2-amino-4-hydroxy-6-hydroxymethyldihydropteridine diphosphokinase [Pseudoclavibacter sp.]